MKSYTDIEQSKKLAEILPFKSADFMWEYNHDKETYWDKPTMIPIDSYIFVNEIPAWSLAALMSVFPKEEGSCTSLSFGYYDVEGNYTSSWLCCYEKEGESTDDYIIETITADNPIDCCYKMILKLKDRNIL